MTDNVISSRRPYLLNYYCKQQNEVMEPTYHIPAVKQSKKNSYATVDYEFKLSSLTYSLHSPKYAFKLVLPITKCATLFNID